jgi:hypothetical protein
MLAAGSGLANDERVPAAAIRCDTNCSGLETAIMRILAHSSKEAIMNRAIVDAIRMKMVLELRYHGYSRLVEPHAYGLDKNGVEKLRCYQTAGGSKSGDRVDWKMLTVGEISTVHTTNFVFSSPRPGYNINDPSISRIYAQL